MIVLKVAWVWIHAESSTGIIDNSAAQCSHARMFQVLD